MSATCLLATKAFLCSMSVPAISRTKSRMPVKLAAVIFRS